MYHNSLTGVRPKERNVSPFPSCLWFPFTQPLLHSCQSATPTSTVKSVHLDSLLHSCQSATPTSPVNAVHLDSQLQPIWNEASIYTTDVLSLLARSSSTMPDIPDHEYCLFTSWLLSACGCLASSGFSMVRRAHRRLSGWTPNFLECYWHYLTCYLLCVVGDPEPSLSPYASCQIPVLLPCWLYNKNLFKLLLGVLWCIWVIPLLTCDTIMCLWCMHVVGPSLTKEKDTVCI